jgi:hypothetical protein
MSTRRARRNLRSGASQCVPERSDKSADLSEASCKGRDGKGVRGGTARRALCSEPLPSPARESPAAAWAGAVREARPPFHGSRFGAGYPSRRRSLSLRRARRAGPFLGRGRGCGLRQRKARRAEARSRRPNRLNGEAVRHWDERASLPLRKALSLALDTTYRCSD